MTTEIHTEMGIEGSPDPLPFSRRSSRRTHIVLLVLFAAVLLVVAFGLVSNAGASAAGGCGGG